MSEITAIIYSVLFTGRKTGSIGIDHDVEESFTSKKTLTNDEVKLKLYENYEHIRIKTIDRSFKKSNRY